MRIAILSDIHGNLTALNAVLADLRVMAPDLVLHGGDLADTGANPVEVIDRIRDLGWPGVAGNTDEMLFRPESLTLFASQSPGLQDMFAKIEEQARCTREALGEERLGWLRELPAQLVQNDIALVHASPDSLWRAPGADAPDDELRKIYGPLRKQVVVYGHIHRPYIRVLDDLTVVNAGSVGMPYDGDPRPSYALLDNLQPSIRRAEFQAVR